VVYTVLPRRLESFRRIAIDDGLILLPVARGREVR